MINKYTNKKSTAMMAVVLAIAMVFAGIVVIATDIDAQNGDDEKYLKLKTSDSEDSLESLFESIEVKDLKGYTIEISVSKGITWGTGSSHGSTPFLPDEIIDKDTMIIIKGAENAENAYFKALGEGVGPIGMNSGTVQFDNIIVKDDSESYAEDSWEFGYLEFRGNTVFNNVVFEDGIQLEGASASFSVCTFNGVDPYEDDPKNYMFGVWVLNGTATFEECTFSGCHGMKIHEQYNNSITGQPNDVTSVTVDTCTFGPFTGTDDIEMAGIAIDTDEETEITICNSTFDRVCPGFQYYYVYDSYINKEGQQNGTFGDITSENNTLILSSVDEKAIIQNGIKLTGDITIGKEVIVEFEKGSSFDGSIMCDGSTFSGKFMAGTNKVTITGGSIIISGDLAPVDGSSDVMLSGEIIVDESVTLSSGITYILEEGSTLVIPDGNSITVEQGATFTIESEAEVTVEGNLTNNGIIEVEENAKLESSEPITGEIENSGITIINGVVEKEGQLGLKDTINSDTTLEADSYLSGNLVIPEGKTLTIKSGVTFDMFNYNLIVNGKLVVEKKATVVSNGGEIRLGLTGVFENAGIVGEKNVITIGLVDIDDANEYGTISMKGLTGVEFSITKVKGTTPSYYLTVSGDVSKIGKENGKLDINGAYIGDLTIDDATGDINGATLMKGCTLTIDSNATMNLVGAPALKMQAATLIIDGELATTSGTVTMVNGSIVTVNGVSDVSFNAVTGVFETYNGDKKVTAEEVYADSSITTDNLKASSVTLTEGKITGITIEVTTSTDIDEDDKSWTTQMMNVSGDLSYNIDASTKKAYESGGVTLAGHVCIPGELVFAKNMAVTGTYDVCVTGTVTAESNVFDGKYIAAYYTIEGVENTDPTMNYYTNFDNAYANIATADDMTITIRGDYTFEKEYVIDVDQKLVLANVDDGTEFIISKDSKITVMDDGVIDGDENIDSIKGILIVMYGGICVPDASAYEVKSVDADDNITYTSAELAISMAQSGDVIEIVGAVTFDDAVTIPEGVTVKVNEGATITAEKDLIVNGKIVNEGKVEAKKNLKVAGEIESVDGELTFDEMTVTGTVTVETAYGETAKVNAATFEGDDGHVYTTVAAAVAATAGEDNPVAVTVLGKVNESAEVPLAEGQTLVIKGEVTIDTIRLVVDSKLDIVSGNLTADVVAAVGTTDALADSVIGMNKVTATTTPLAEVTVTYSEKDDLYTMKLDEFRNGDVVIESGAVSYTNASLEVTADKTFKVAAGAQLDIDNPVAFSGTPKSFINEGTIDVTVGSSFTGLDIAGTVNVAKNVTLTIEGGNVIGTITGGDIAITADVKVGTAPETLGATGSISGKATLASGEYVTVYAGSAFVDTTEDSNIKSTAYTVNGIAYATVYAIGGEIGVLNTEILALDDLDATTIAWKDADGNDVSATAAIGTPDAVYAEVAYKAADITVSAGPGLIVYIDDLKVEDNTTSLKVGTHTVTVYVDAGYEGTPVIKLNGTEITDGKIVVTSDMVGNDKDNMLVITGATPATSQPVVIQPSDSEKDGMELTDILLIVLVVLIVIMAIIVALRMMRS